MITSSKWRPRNRTGRLWLTDSPYQICPPRLQQSQMDDKKYIGMDVHQATISVAVRDSARKLVSGDAASGADSIRLMSCSTRGKVHVATDIAQQRALSY